VPSRDLRRRALQVIRALGGFRMARWLTRGDLRILCYHGFAMRDEGAFRPGLFISADDFRARLTHLRDAGYRVLPLHDALERQRARTLPPYSVAITIDDGFYGTLKIAAPMLQRFGMPATVYLTTYYVVHQLPIFNLAAAYLFWRTDRPTIDLRGLGLRDLEEEALDWRALPPDARDAVVTRIISDAGGRLSRAERSALLERLAERTGVSLAEIIDERLFHLVSTEEARTMQALGIDLQLHTHRHRSPGEAADADRELVDNAAVLRRITGGDAVHFCYPSGRFDRWRDEWLSRRGVRSATTCVPGFVRAGAPPYRLGRFLDGADIDQLSFEAELAGVLEVARRVRARLRGRPEPTFQDDPAEGRPLQAAGRSERLDPTPVPGGVA
jgi:peptidoglycan/xylan/chitin deacetylase (PgdA/CDA1 family)